jgi:triosephosphate isomerase
MATLQVLVLLAAAACHAGTAFEIVSPVAKQSPVLRGAAVAGTKPLQGQSSSFVEGTPVGLRLASAIAALAAAVAMRASRRPVVGGNWKCNPESMSKLDGLIANIQACDTSKCDVYVCPSPLHVAYCADKFSNGAMVTPQNCNIKGCGAFTGETAVEQMKDLGITQVLLGHSERRGEFGIFPMDNDTTLATKLKYILDAGMSCVFCIGEPLTIREKGLPAVLAEMHVQLTQIYSLLDPAKVIIAYEPVWAIGTGVTATPEDAQATHAGIRKLISEHASTEVADGIRIQYGGSANAANAPDLSAQPDIDGFLVGGASLKPEFKEIVDAISAAK